jgi:molybdenum cofactor cytidylyltransferase
MVSGAILAAGYSTRMGMPKQSVVIGKSSMLQMVTDVFLASKLEEVIVVVRPGLALKLREPLPSRVKLVSNLEAEKGMSSSLRIALNALGGSDAVLVGLGDMPAVLTSTIDSLVEAYRKSGKRIVIPIYEGRRGNPVLFDRILFGDLEALSGDVGGKDVIRQNEDEVLEVTVTDVGVVTDVDDPAGLRAAEAILSERSSREPGEPGY